MNQKKKINYYKQKVCYICTKEFDNNDNDKKQQKVRDHCHYTGKYRGAAHNICNLRYKVPKEISVSSVKWELLTCNEVGLSQIFNHVKTIKKPLKLPFYKKHHFLR